MAGRKRRRHRHHGNPFSVRDALEPRDWAAVFGRQAPLALDVGFGEGHFLLELAAAHPEWNVVGLEIRQHLVEAAADGVAERGLPNCCPVLANANLHLEQLIPPKSVQMVAVNHPDPWYKRRHQKRRVVRPEWVALLTTRLLPGAQLHAMSDYEPIALEMRQVFEAQAGLENLDGAGRFAAESTTGIVTEREVKHLARGEPVYRMRFVWHPTSA